MDDFFKLPDPTIAVPDVGDVLRATAPGPWTGRLTPVEVVIGRSDHGSRSHRAGSVPRWLLAEGHRVPAPLGQATGPVEPDDVHGAVPIHLPTST